MHGNMEHGAHSHQTQLLMRLESLFLYMCLVSKLTFHIKYMKFKVRAFK